MSRNPNRMQEATDRLMSRFKLAAAVTVTYMRGSTVITGLVATVGRTPFDISDGQVIIAYESRDYLIAKADLVDADAHQVTPASGYIITDGGRDYEFSIPKPMNVFESIGPNGSVFKIHTKAVT